VSKTSVSQTQLRRAGLKPPVVTIEPLRGWAPLALRELWNCRELIYFFVWRDVKIRYKQTILGAAWAVLQPLLTMVVFSVIFGHLAGLPSDGTPYPIFTYTALLPWQLFAYALSQTAISLVAHQQLLKKVYFPRLVIPISAVLCWLVDFSIGFVVLLAMMFYYGIAPTLAIITVPLFVVLAMAAALAVGLWLATLNVQFRDVRYAIPFLIQFWLFITPVAYSSSLILDRIPERWRFLYGLNPMTGVVEGFRWALLGKSGEAGLLIIVSGLVVVGLLLGGLIYFRRMEGTFSDVV
jgi:lipopolysaccharide transport system permease protein